MFILPPTRQLWWRTPAAKLLSWRYLLVLFISAGFGLLLGLVAQLQWATFTDEPLLVLGTVWFMGISVLVLVCPPILCINIRNGPRMMRRYSNWYLVLLPAVVFTGGFWCTS